MKIGQKVIGPHGAGVIIGLNGQQPADYVLFARGKECFEAALSSGLITAGIFYSGDKYPYIVKFDDGYEDVYAESELVAHPH